MALWSKAGPIGVGITEKNRFVSDQLRLRLRLHCCGIPAVSLPNTGNIANGLDGATSPSPSVC
jgi:hypothetical protein